MNRIVPTRTGLPGSRPAYCPEIDGLRALAVLAVIANHFHADALPSGYLGVDIFFVISGFVITASLASQPDGQSLGAFLAGFYSRRIRRILPALMVCVLITSLLVALFDTHPTTSLQTGLSALFGFSNQFLFGQSVDYFAPASELNAFLQTWSLGVEEQFYLVFPLLFWLARKARIGGGSHGLLAVILGLATAVSLALFVHLASQHNEAFYFLMPPRFWELSAGALLVLLHRAGRLRGEWQSIPSLLPLGLLLAALWLPRSQELAATVVVVALTLAVLSMGLAGSDCRLVTVLSHPWAVGLGLLSYSLYLWHWPVLVLSRWTIGIEPATLPLQVGLIGSLALASYHWVERPLRQRSWAASDRNAILKGLMAASVGALGVWTLKVPLRHQLYLGKFHGSERSEEWGNLAVAGTTIDPEVCNTQTTDASVLLDRSSFARYAAECSSEPDRPSQSRSERPPHVYVVGDSHAMAFSPVAAGLRKEGYGISIFSRPGCPFPSTRYGHLQANCSRFQQAVAAHVLAQGRPGDAVVIVNYLLSHLGDAHRLRDTRNEFRGPSGAPLSNVSDKWEVWQWGLERFSAGARARGLQVVVVGATPRNVEFFTCRQEWFNVQGARRCDGLVASEQTSARQLNQRISAELSPGVSLFDPLAVLCPKTCSNYTVSRLLRDTDHLSTAGSRQLLPAFTKTLSLGRRADGVPVPN